LVHALVHTFLLLTLIGLIDERSTVAPQPDQEDAKHEQRHGQPHNLVSPWGHGDLRLEHQGAPHQQEGHSVGPPAWTVSCASHRSCTSSLRVIPSVQKSRKMPSYNDEMRTFCHDIASFFLPTRLPRSTLVVSHAPLHLAKRSGHTTSESIPASLATTPKALPRA